MNLHAECLPLFLLAALLNPQDPKQPEAAPQDPAPLADEAQIAANAERERAAREAQELEYFRRCDANGNDWLSLREAQESLGLDSNAFASYDTDQDGRVTRQEFGARYRMTVERVGGFKPPVDVAVSVSVPTRNAEQLRNAYDKNGDGGLSADEMKLLLIDYERSELPAELAVEKLDRDGSSRVDGSEIEFLARLLTSSVSPATADRNAPQVRQTLEELFGGLHDRSSGYRTAPMPPRIDGPVTQFRRLDLDGDGVISPEDLQRLQAPLNLPVRSAAVLAALDSDGDGKLTPVEFAQALGSL
jgi:Ca2+-binding EF-hand superfamily protein